MRIRRCVGCGDVLSQGASAAYGGAHELEGLFLCADTRHASLKPKLSCARSAARADSRFGAVVTALEAASADSKRRWRRVAVAAMLVAALFPSTAQASRCVQTDPKACGGSPSRCSCAKQPCRCIVAPKRLLRAACHSCDPKRSSCFCSCENGACCCE